MCVGGKHEHEHVLVEASTSALLREGVAVHEISA
jgi:hypothetical protein